MLFLPIELGQLSYQGAISRVLGHLSMLWTCWEKQLHFIQEMVLWFVGLWQFYYTSSISKLKWVE
jgi:membrane associated rhomboid family serine protease